MLTCSKPYVNAELMKLRGIVEEFMDAFECWFGLDPDSTEFDAVYDRLMEKRRAMYDALEGTPPPAPNQDGNG